MNTWQLSVTRCQQAVTVRSEFKKLVYDSEFTKCAEVMNFVNSFLTVSPTYKPWVAYGGEGSVTQGLL